MRMRPKYLWESDDEPDEMLPDLGDDYDDDEAESSPGYRLLSLCHSYDNYQEVKDLVEGILEDERRDVVNYRIQHVSGS